jgi:protein-disulfide isomerase
MEAKLSDSSSKRIIFVLSLAGILVALVAGLSHRLEWLAALCTGLGDGCKATAQFSLFALPVWLWGAIYYLLVSALWVGAYGWLFWVLAAGFGVELGLMWAMLSMNTVCVFCVANFAVMVALVLCSLHKARIWQTLTVTLAAFILSTALIPKGNGIQSYTASKQDPFLVARVAGQVITYDELVQPVASRIYDLQQQIYRLERDRLDQLVAKKALEKEAENQGKPLQELLKEFLASQSVTVEDHEVDDYYAENRSRFAEWNGSQQELFAQIRAYLLQVKRQQTVLEYSKSLGSKYDVAVYLKEPQSPMIQVAMEKDDPVLGPSNAPLTIFEFSDYQCPACRRTHAVVRELQQLYNDRIRWVFKNFPMPGHKWARGAAMAAFCAAEQGKFWEYHDLLFSSHEDLSPQHLLELAKGLGLQQDTFINCLDAGKSQANVERHIEEGKKFGLDTTPTFIINNRLVSGAPPADRLKEIIDEELQRVAKDS